MVSSGLLSAAARSLSLTKSREVKFHKSPPENFIKAPSPLKISESTNELPIFMFNNAGVVGEAKPNILDNDKAEFEQVISVNLIGAFLGTKLAARAMIPARRGSIISTASICSTIAGVGPHAYTSSKHAIVGLTKNTAVELGQYGIRVNCVSPYVVATPMAREFHKMDENNGYHRIYFNLNGAILGPEDVAESVLYLGSDDSKYVSGINLILDGGFTIVNPKLCMFDPSK